MLHALASRLFLKHYSHDLRPAETTQKVLSIRA
jgi:hypothetical protein